MNHHTPGPWKISKLTRSAINATTESGIRKHIAMVNYYKCEHYDLTGQEHEANAHLICAAPELLAACQRALSFLDAKFDISDASFTSRDETVDLLRKAITKASASELLTK